MASSSKGVHLSAVQPYMTLLDYTSEEAFFAHMHRLLQAADAGRSSDAAIVVLPEDLATFLALLGAPERVRELGTLDEAFALLGRAQLAPLARTMLARRTFRIPVAFFHLTAPVVYGAWHRTMSRLAREFHITLVGGSALLPENGLGYTSDKFRASGGAVYNLALTFGPDGRVVAVTRKRNLVPTQEDRLYLSRGPAIPAAPVPVGNHRLGVAICYDAFVTPHTSREPGFEPLVPKLAALGADIIAQPSANPWTWTDAWVFAQASDHRSRREQWQQEGLLEAMRREPSIRAGINPQLLATLFDTHFDGQSAIYVREGDTVLPVVEAAQGDARPDAETVIGWSLPF
jgi:predicted amidohydrolase